jgi:hypothetical protein
MSLVIGDPVSTGFYGIYEVPAVRRSASGRLTASGKVLVNVVESAATYGIVLDGSEDDATIKKYAKQIAWSMINDDPDLLPRFPIVPNGPGHLERDDEKSPPWDGDGYPDTKDDDTPEDEPKRILSPDSGQTGGF